MAGRLGAGTALIVSAADEGAALLGFLSAAVELAMLVEEHSREVQIHAAWFDGTPPDGVYVFTGQSFVFETNASHQREPQFETLSSKEQWCTVRTDSAYLLG